jgi:hypothetical protein
MSHLDHFILGLAIGLLGIVGTVAYIVGRRVHAGHVVRVQRNMEGRKVVALSIGNRQATLTPTAALAIATALLHETARIAPGLHCKASRVRGRHVEGALRAASEQVVVPTYTGKTPLPRVPS